MPHWRLARVTGLALWTLTNAVPAIAQTIETARYTEPTERYPHGVLGDAIEHGALEVLLDDGTRLTARIEPVLVFEDTEPRVIDLDGDGSAEVLTVEAHQAEGARVAIWGLADGTLALRAATPFIGTRFRWLGIVGAADLDGDGATEIAYVDRPHLARVLRVWRYESTGAAVRLTEVARADGHTNHRIGERDIAGGIRLCGGAPEMLTASRDWSAMRATRLVDGTLQSREIGRDTSRGAFADALACRTP